MTGPIFANNAVGTLAASYSAAATSITLTAGQGSLFPAPGSGDWFAMTIVNSSNVMEILRCTARSGDTFTVQRGQEGTLARALASGEKVEHRLTAAMLIAIRDRPLDPSQIPLHSIDTPQLADYCVNSMKLRQPSVVAAHLDVGCVGAVAMAPGATVGNLGYTPVRQGTGPGQLGNSISVGWTAALKLRMSVDNVDEGYVLNERQDGSPDSGGYRGRPPNNQNIDYVIGLSDMGRTIYHQSNTPHIYYLPNDATAAFQRGSPVFFVNLGGGAITITTQAPANLILSPSGTIGARTLSAYGQCTAYKVDGNAWYIFGNGLS